MYIALLDTNYGQDVSSDLISNIMYDAQKYGIQREYVVMLRSNFIIDILPKMKQCFYGYFEAFEIKDHKWPILMTLQEKQCICAACGKFGHVHKVCRRQFCLLCRRLGHTKVNCFAKTEIDGNSMNKLHQSHNSSYG